MKGDCAYLSDSKFGHYHLYILMADIGVKYDAFTHIIPLLDLHYSCTKLTSKQI